MAIFGVIKNDVKSFLSFERHTIVIVSAVLDKSQMLTATAIPLHLGMLLCINLTSSPSKNRYHLLQQQIEQNVKLFQPSMITKKKRTNLTCSVA